MGNPSFYLDKTMGIIKKDNNTPEIWKHKNWMKTQISRDKSYLMTHYLCLLPYYMEYNITQLYK